MFKALQNLTFLCPRGAAADTFALSVLGLEASLQEKDRRFLSLSSLEDEASFQGHRRESRLPLGFKAKG